MRKIEQLLAEHILLCDGAFGTYYTWKYDTLKLPERANTRHPGRVRTIHTQYRKAGAQMIRTNTYASNTVMMAADFETVAENIRQGYRLAKEAAGDALVAADIGPIPYENMEEKERAIAEYVDICRVFLAEGADIFVFETFADMDDILPALELIGDRAYVIVQFAVNQYGYSSAGLSGKKLLERAAAHAAVDATGFNCGIGPAHMHQLLQRIKLPEHVAITAFPNAGYPQNIKNRMLFPKEDTAYFVQRTEELLADGISIIGGCCGTVPESIAGLHEVLARHAEQKPQVRSDALRHVAVPSGQPVHAEQAERTKQDSSFFANKKNGGKLIAVELAPPFGNDYEKLMDAAHTLKRCHVDVLTFPDSPSGRTRADSVLTAGKVARETGMCVMPHLCCRDKNAIAIRAELLGAYMNDIKNFLVITGDPIPMSVRNTVKSVFNFDSIGLMRVISDMNDELFGNDPICFGGAINPCRKQSFEITRVKRKMDAGASFFLSQPISSEAGAEFLRQVKEETGARILAGVMPFVSLKNALFIKNEMAGIEVSDEVLSRYRADMTREEGEQAGVELARSVIERTKDYVDGYYFSFPFNRVGMLERILAPDM